jgi:anti-sigma28 factor (negative regulator of flagellin synthesis)
MNNSSSVSSVSSAATSSSKLTNTQNKNKDSIDDVITINEKVNLTKQQHQVLKIICDTYETSFSECIQQALVEAMRFDIEEGNLCDALLEKIGAEDSSSIT